MDSYSQNHKNSDSQKVSLSSSSVHYLNNIENNQESLEDESYKNNTDINENFSLPDRKIQTHQSHESFFNVITSISNISTEYLRETLFCDHPESTIFSSPCLKRFGEGKKENSDIFQRTKLNANSSDHLLAYKHVNTDSLLQFNSTNQFSNDNSPINLNDKYSFANQSKAFLGESSKLFNHSNLACEPSPISLNCSNNFLGSIPKDNFYESGYEQTLQIQNSHFKMPAESNAGDFERNKRSVLRELQKIRMLKSKEQQDQRSELLKLSVSCAEASAYNMPDLSMFSKEKYPQPCATITSMSEEVDKIDETLIAKLCPNLSSNLEKMGSQASIGLDLSYECKIITKTPTRLLLNYYEIQQTKDWNKEVQNIILSQNPSIVMEENFDYIDFKLRHNKVLPDFITVGQKDVIIDLSRNINNEDIEEPMKELDISWNDTEISATSTPKSLSCTQRSCTQILTEMEMSLTCIPIISDLNNSINKEIPLVPPNSQLHAITEEVDSDLLMLLWCNERDDAVLDMRKTKIMERIEKVMLDLLKDLKADKIPIIELQGDPNWDNCTMENDVLTQRSTSKVKKISFFAKSSERKFAVVVNILVMIHKLLGSNSTSTKRELYYNNPEFFQSQNTVDRAISDISYLLNANPWEFAILPSSKGLVAGDLKIVTTNYATVDFTVYGAVPTDVTGIKSFESTAKFILVVEKDTVFQRLLNMSIFSRINKKLILITAKGYPDVNTRLFLQRLVKALRIPVYALVDADPYGIEIMFTYRFGSLSMSQISDSLAVPSVRWIGIFPTEIFCLDVPSISLTARDKKKIIELQKRPYMNSAFTKELKALSDGGVKSEIEGVSSFSINYLIDEYILNKIQRSI